jgi:hypothetical protein
MGIKDWGLLSASLSIIIHKLIQRICNNVGYTDLNLDRWILFLGSAQDKSAHLILYQNSLSCCRDFSLRSSPDHFRFLKFSLLPTSTSKELEGEIGNHASLDLFLSPTYNGMLQISSHFTLTFPALGRIISSMSSFLDHARKPFAIMHFSIGLGFTQNPKSICDF